MTHTRRYLSALLLACAVGAQAQTSDVIDPYVHEPLPAGAPAWMAEISKNPTGVNFREMQQLYRDWLISDPDARAKTREKKPIVNYYRRWQRAYERFVGEDGMIHLPTVAEHTARLSQLNTRSTRRKAEAKDGKVWKNIGPYTTRTGGKSEDSQACVFRLSICEQNPNILYAGTDKGVVFKSTDKGQSWKPCNAQHNFGGSIYSVQVDPKDPNVVYCGGGVSLWKSTDGGETWVQQQGVQGNVNSIRFSPNDSKYVTFATGMARGKSGGFYVTVNGGQSYHCTFTGLCYDHELKPNDPNYIYMLGKDPSNIWNTDCKIYISKDGGMHWDEAPTSNVVTNIQAGRLAVSQAPGGEDYVYAIANSRYLDDTSGPLGGMGDPSILKSTDAGQTWQNLSTEGGLCPFNSSDKNGGQGYFDMIIGASSQNPDLIIYGLTCCYRAVTGGTAPSTAVGIGGYIPNTNMHPDMQDIVTLGTDTYISTDGGIRHSTNFFATGGETRHDGIYAAEYVGYGQGWNKDVMAGGRWHNGDAVMTESYGEGNSLHVGGIERATGYVMLSDPHKVYFSDGAMYTIPETNIDDRVITDYSYFSTGRRPAESTFTSNEVDFDPRYAHRLIITPSYEGWGCDPEDVHTLYMSEDEGKSFRKIFDCEERYVQSHAHARSNPDHLYVVTQYSIFHSTDNGEEWEEFEVKPFDDGRDQAGASIAVDPHNDNILWYANGYYAGQVAYTKDNGKTWTYPLEGTAYAGKRFAWIVLTGYKNGVYLSTNLGDYESGQMVIYRDDETNGWVNYSAGLPSAAVISRLAPFYKEGKLRAATYQGIWEIPLYHEQFVPVAQPMALNLGNGNLSDPMKEVLFDSYSIVNQEQVQWEWSFSPEPYKVEGANTRNPKVVFGRKGEYDVTLTVTTPQGTHSRTIESMITLSQSAPGLDDITTGVTPSAASRTPQINVEVAYAGGVPSLVVHSENLTSDKKFRLYSLKGALLQEVLIPATETLTEVSLGQLAPGSYVYNLSAQDYKYYGKFIKK